MADSLINLRETFDLESTGELSPMSLPWSRLTFALGGGLRPGTLSLLVGEPGTAKTYLASAICLHAHERDSTWAYWPFERDDVYAARRFLAVLANRWSVLDPGEARSNASLLEDDGIFEQMVRITPNIEPNPRQMRQDRNGEFYVPRCEYREILGRLRVLCEERGLVVLDPLSMLSFDDGGRDAWKGQEDFAKDAAAIVAQTGTRLLLVHHVRKSSPGGKPRHSGLDEVAGAAALSRFADNVIFLEHAPDSLESEIVDEFGIHKTRSHKRTLFVAKARDGKGTGWRIGCDLGEDGPTLTEYGFIQRKAVK